MKATRKSSATKPLARSCAIISLGIWLGCVTAHASEPVPPLVATVATTTLDAGGRPWAYLVFNPNRPGLLDGRTFGVYVKPGTPDAPAAFTFRGVVGASTDPSVINVMLARAASLGDNLGALEAQVIGLHRLLINTFDSSTTASLDPPPMPLNQRLAAVLNRAGGDTSLGQLLDMLGLAHPAVRLVRGTAWAAPLTVAVGADTTLEVRERTPAGSDGAVLARVSFKAGQPALLPAPGPLAVVPDTTAAGDLAIKLRWATPLELRQAGTRHHGDVVWRVSRAFAESHGFTTTPPAGAALDALTLGNAADVKRVGGPVFSPKLFAASDVADFVADATTSYLADDNGRHAAGGVALTEGAQYYYFAAGADALGKPGAVSAGVLATVCGRIPPHVPSHLAVANIWTLATSQSLDVTWLTNAAGDGTAPTTYEIFRGDDLAAHAAAQQGLLDLTANPIDPAHPTAIARIASVADPAAAQQTLHVADDGGGLPNVGKTWWFAVRAVHQSPPGCGDLTSALSPPVFGALRNQSAPPAPAAADIAPPVLDCLRVACISDLPAANTTSSDPLDTSVVQFTAQCARRNRGVIAAHLHVMDGATEVVPETALVFPEDDDMVEYSWTLPLVSLSDTLDVQCRAESTTGFLSSWADSSAAGVDPTGNQFVLYHFLAGAISEGERQDADHASDPLWASLGAPAGDWPADVHLTSSPDTGRVFHPQFSLPFPTSSEQYRVYRRVEDGPLTLIAQGLRRGAATLNWEDPAPPVSNGHVHYFAQLLDESGRPSAMRRLGSLRFTGDKPPTPVLLTPKPADFGGTLAAPTVTLSWICPPEHVDRFEVFFKTAKPSTGTGSGSGIAAITNFSLRMATLPSVHKVTSKFEQTLRFVAPVNESFLTGKVGSGLGAGPKFSVTMTVDPNLNYSVWLRALGPGGELGDSSRSLDFQWQPPVAPPPNIAWPARPLPPVGAFNSGISVIDFRNVDPNRLIWHWSYGHVTATYSVVPDQTPVGIRVGAVPVDQQTIFTVDSTGNMVLGFRPGYTGSGKGDPNNQIYPHATDASQRLLPFVLYRQQVSNAAFPSVSGDVIQASPLITKIPTISFVDPQLPIWTMSKLMDPFFRWLGPGPDLLLYTVNPKAELYLVDTQPVVTGACYRYWLMRFNSLGEPIQTIPCGEITITAKP